jgi:hypothetical protein
MKTERRYLCSWCGLAQWQIHTTKDDCMDALKKRLGEECERLDEWQSLVRRFFDTEVDKKVRTRMLAELQEILCYGLTPPKPQP